MPLSFKQAIALHINYFEQGQSLDRACAMALELGADGIEFRRLPTGYPGTEIEYLDELSKAIDRHSLSWVSFGGPGVNLMSFDTDEVARNLDHAETFYREAARRFPLKVVNALSGNLLNADKALPYLEYWHHGSAVAMDRHWETATMGFRRLGSVASELGFRFAFETHGCYLHDTVEATSRLIREINSPNVGMLWDQANLMIFPDAPSMSEVLATAAPHIFYVHLKNLLVSPSRFLAVCGLSDGIINIREQVSALANAGYRGPLCIESPREGDREYFARNDLDYLRSVLTDLYGTIEKEIAKK